MAIEIVPARFCATYWAEYVVPSDSHPKESYLVALAGGEGPAYCACPAFKHRKGSAYECKHIRRVFKEACLWNPQWREQCGTTMKPARLHAPNLSTRPEDACPACGGPTVA